MDYSNLRTHLKTMNKDTLVELIILLKMELKAHLEGGEKNGRK